ncbi:MAG TPA: hypothetical protein VHF26_18075 [Trebonia sp.]|nr:hypothetical protein [Trebonia sp.]
MFLSGALFIPFLAGCWLYCLADAVLTPASEFPGRRKRAWIAVIAVTFILGAVAWAVFRGSRRRRFPPAAARPPALAGYDDTNVRWYPDDPTTVADPFRVAEALARHPASRARKAEDAGRTVPIGPDDDPEFLRELAERIRRGE